MRSIAVIACIVLLSGCELAAGVESVALMASETTLSDHIISLSSGKDCSWVRREKGLHYCKEDEPLIRPNIYCYNTLGRVTCYDRPDPYGGGQQKVGDNEHNMAK